jgi:ABC-2 type transport system permease protein
VSTIETRGIPLDSLWRPLRLGARRALYEIRIYFRMGDTVFFTFLFPAVMLTIFSVAFSAQGNIGTNPDGSGGVSIETYYLAAMIAAGILLSGVQNLATDIAVERSDGTLKRLAGTPLPVFSYFMGKFGQVAVTSLLQTGLLLALSAFVFGVELPTEPEKWVTFVWVYVLGLATCALLGIALSRVPRSGKSATAVIIPIVLILQFISGIYIQFSVLPEWLQTVASIFPLKWIAQGMRYVFLPDSFAAVEQNGEWNLEGVALVLLIWLVVGLVVSIMTFRWIRKNG